MAEDGSVGSALARRRAERERLLGLARRFVESLPVSIGPLAAVVVGSVARGDFNVWSDVDVLVVAEHLPERPQDRLGLLLAAAPAGVQPIAWTPAELASQRRAGNPIAREAVERGLVLFGELSVL